MYMIVFNFYINDAATSFGVMNFENADEPVLSMIKVDGTPAIKLEVGYVDKPNSKMLADLIKLCSDYLPDEDDE